MKDRDTENYELPEMTQAALSEAERLLRVARGEHVDGALSRTPWDFNLPTSEELRAMRERCGISRKQFAEELGYSKSAVSNYENGVQSPGREYIRSYLHPEESA